GNKVGRAPGESEHRLAPVNHHTFLLVIQVEARQSHARRRIQNNTVVQNPIQDFDETGVLCRSGQSSAHVSIVLMKSSVRDVTLEPERHNAPYAAYRQNIADLWTPDLQYSVNLLRPISQKV